MSKQSTKAKPRTASGRPTGNGGGLSATTRSEDDRRSGMANLAHEAADSIKDAASSGASSVKRQVSDALDRQVASGADVISRVASSTRRAADDLEKEVPQIAGMIRSVANKVDTYADDMKDRSIEDIIRTASDFTRRQPAMVFGLAALAGFLFFRAIKTASEHEDRSDMYPSTDMDYRRQAAGNVGGSGEYFS